jgi:mRNA-degrading endonuclease RelE of RelBE toxin-antitoxin system
MRHFCRVNYRLEISEEALEQLRALPKEARRRIGFRLDALQADLQGDVKKLTGQAGRYRLRVGEYRVPSALEKDLIMVHQVKDRKDAYRD